MKKIVLTFGIIAGLICGLMFFIMHPAGEKFDFEGGEVTGYLTMIIALSTIFFAVKQYRDKYNGGVIKFGKAFLIGLYITLVAGAIYVITWEIYYKNYAPDFTDLYMEYMESKMADEGKSEAVIAEEMAPQKEMMETYKNNLLIRIAFTLIEIVPVGLLISLISAFIFGVFLKKKPDQLARESS